MFRWLQLWMNNFGKGSAYKTVWSRKSLYHELSTIFSIHNSTGFQLPNQKYISKSKLLIFLYEISRAIRFLLLVCFFTALFSKWFSSLCFRKPMPRFVACKLPKYQTDSLLLSGLQSGLATLHSHFAKSHRFKSLISSYRFGLCGFSQIIKTS